MNQNNSKQWLSKVPEVTIFFWIIKVLCTTVGETFADYLNFNLGLGLTLTTTLMGLAFCGVLLLQFRATQYTPGIYWLTVVLISVFGTLVTDNLTDNIGVPLEASTIVFAVLLGLTFLAWHYSEKTLSIHSIYTRKREAFYWLTILFTFALGTAVGDLYSEQLGLGYLNTGLSVILIVVLVYAGWKFVRLDSVLAFWVVYILTRPLGASLGDYLSQPKSSGALGLGTTITSVIFLAAIFSIIVLLTVTRLDVSVKNELAAVDQVRGNKKQVIRQTYAVMGIFLVIGVGGYIGLDHHISAQMDTQQTTFAEQLGDFIQIEQDMLHEVNADNFATLKTKADELEHQWDINEPKLRKMNGAAWTRIDGSIDVVLAAARSGSINVSKSKAAINDSLSIMNNEKL
ncbi:hypothetical protein ACFFSY_22510 [Paenibacillus aurantiacus]|uniref:Membrane-anchored protein n=1 Tax=Paenibacillus aurantiacus TaxID=1936118 RepID=A0ABV5KXD1_9BACL